MEENKNVRAQQHLREAMADLEAVEGGDDESRQRLATSLNAAMEALAEGDSQCREKRPFAELILVARDGKVGYECTHPERHWFPL